MSGLVPKVCVTLIPWSDWYCGNISPFASVCMVVVFTCINTTWRVGMCPICWLPCLLKLRCKFRCVYPVSFTRNRHSQIEVVRLLEVSGIDIAISQPWGQGNDDAKIPKSEAPEGQLSTKRERKSAPCALGECSDQWDTKEKIVSPYWHPKLQIASAHFTFTPCA